MTTTFNERERGYENKFAHDQETEFKILARSNYLLGLWAAEKIHLTADSAENYAQNLLEIGIQKNSKSLVQEKLENDFANAGLEMSKQDIEAEAENFLKIARDQVTNAG